MAYDLTSFKGICRMILSWISMLWLWESISNAVFIYNNKAQYYVLYRYQSDLLIAIFHIIWQYISYFSFAWTSPTFSFLITNQRAESIDDFLKKRLNITPHITWELECYHIKTEFIQTYDQYGRVEAKEIRSKIVTHKAYQNFNFNTWKFNSDLLLSDSHRNYLRKKAFIKLELVQSIDFADDMTRYDYQRQKDDFYNRNKLRDEIVEIIETRNDKEINQYNLLRGSNENPLLINKYAYVLFCFLLPFAEMYHLYVDKYCIEQHYELKKLVSTRHDLNKPLNYQFYPTRAAVYEQPQPRQIYQQEAVFNNYPGYLPRIDEGYQNNSHIPAVEYPQMSQIDLDSHNPQQPGGFPAQNNFNPHGSSKSITKIRFPSTKSIKYC